MNMWLLWKHFKKSKKGMISLCVLMLFFLIGLYAPLLASSQPLLVIWNHEWFSPLLRYLFYPGYYTKPIDLFYNVLMFTFPAALLGSWFIGKRLRMPFLAGMFIVHCVIFGCVLSGMVKNPANTFMLTQARQQGLAANTPYREDPLLASFSPKPTWEFDLKHMNTYEKLSKLLRYQQQQARQKRLAPYLAAYKETTGQEAPTLLAVQNKHEEANKVHLEKTIQETKAKFYKARAQLPELIEAYRPFSHAYIMAKYTLEHASEEQRNAASQHYQHVLQESADTRTPLLQARQYIESYKNAVAQLTYLEQKTQWYAQESARLHTVIPPLLRDFHWEEDAGGSQTLNTFLPWWELTRINRKDLVAGLLFGIRISVMVGVTAVGLSLLIGIPIGVLSGYFAGKLDLVACRCIEIWEAMPTFFMLLLVVAITQSKSIFLVIGVLGIFGWTSFGRFIRAEVLKQRNLPYVLACKSIGYPHRRIMFSHILPNAISPILTLLPFSVMAAITSEAGISFLGLGEEGTTSWGILMDEGRSVFPAESYLLWPPAMLLTLLLVCIALVGDTVRDALDPKKT